MGYLDGDRFKRFHTSRLRHDKEVCFVETQGNIADLAAGAPLTVDGETMVADVRVFVGQNQTAGAERGIYRVVTPGTGADGVWAREFDADSSVEIVPGMEIFVTNGTVGEDKSHRLTTDAPITIDVTSLTFVDTTADVATIALNSVHRLGDGSDHADVATNTTHSTGDGSDHSAVATNTTHSGGDGSDHADVATNTSAIGAAVSTLLGGAVNSGLLLEANGDGALTGGTQYRGFWNAITNTPTLADGVGTTGDFFIVSDAGTTLIDGEDKWQKFDIIFFDVLWQRKPADTTAITTGTAGDEGLLLALDSAGLFDSRDIGADGDKLDTVETNADVTDTANVDAAGAVMDTDFSTQSILIAITDDTPVAENIPVSSFFGRKAAGDLGSMSATEATALLNVATAALKGLQANTDKASHDLLVSQILN